MPKYTPTIISKAPLNFFAYSEKLLAPLTPTMLSVSPSEGRLLYIPLRVSADVAYDQRNSREDTRLAAEISPPMNTAINAMPCRV